MAAISQTISSDALTVNKKFYMLLKISQKFVPKFPFHKNPALVYIMVWRRILQQAIIGTNADMIR